MRSLILGLLAAVLPAQQTPAPPVLAKVIGVARTHDGAPWAGAVVHIVEAAGDDSDSDPGSLDQRSVITDEHGRFAVDALSGCTYAGWAEAPAEDGTVRFSAVVSDIRAGTKAEFTADEKPRGKRSFQLDLSHAGVDGDVRLTVWALHARIPIELPLGPDGVVTVPPLPADLLTIQVFDTAGHWLAEAHLSPDAAPKVLHLPPRLKRHVRTLSTNGKKPLAKARIVVMRRGNACELALTDDAGEADLLMPMHAEFDVETERPLVASPWAVVFAKGMNAGSLVLHTEGSEFGPQEEMPKGIDGICRVADSGREPPPVTLLSDGKPLAGARVFVSFSASHQVNENSSMGFGCRMVMQSGADGALDLSFMERTEQSTTLLLRIDDALRARLPAEWTAHLPSWVPLWIDRSGDKPIAIDLLRDLVPIEFRLLRADDHAPAANVKLLAGTGELNSPHPVVTDRLGRARIPLPRNGPPILVGTLGEAGWCAVEVDARALGRPGVEPVATLTLRRCIPLVIKADTPAGAKKIENLWGYLGNSRGGAFGMIIATQNGGRAKDSDPKPETLVRAIADDDVAGTLIAGYSSIAFTDHTSTAYVPDLAAQYQLNVGANVDGAWSNGTVQIEVQGKEESVPVAVSLGGN